ncbi:MAG: hypothetical protein ACHQ2Y_10420 [Candidatus Lutacidiplasmatales archaeon]
MTDPEAAARIPHRSQAVPQESLAFRRRYHLSRARLDERFCSGSEEGASVEAILGPVGGSPMTTAYLLPLSEGFELGVAMRPAPHVDRAQSLPVGLEGLEEHPMLAPLLAGAEPVGPWGRAAAPGGAPQNPTPSHGFLLAGDALGLSGGGGIVLPALDPWLASARCAQRSVQRILRQGGRGSGGYSGELARDGLLAESARHRAIARRLVWNPRMHREYPTLLCKSFHRLMTETGGPKQSIRSIVQASRRAAGVRTRTLLFDAMRVGGAL